MEISHLTTTVVRDGEVFRIVVYREADDEDWRVALHDEITRRTVEWGGSFPTDRQAIVAVLQDSLKHTN